MPDVFLGQIMMSGFIFAPKGFAACNGALLSISQNPALFALLGTNFGGDGISTFALPDLRSRTPVGFSRSLDSDWQPEPHALGQAGGVEAVSLRADELPSHDHAARGSTAAGTGRNPTNALYGATSRPIYAAAGGALVTLAAESVAAAGAGQPHQNLQPYETVTFAIALNGIFPSRT